MTIARHAGQTSKMKPGRAQGPRLVKIGFVMFFRIGLRTANCRGGADVSPCVGERARGLCGEKR